MEHALASSYDVLGISRSPEPAACFLPYRWKTEPEGEPNHSVPAPPRGRFQFIQANLNAELDKVIQEVEAFKPLYVVNFSAQGMVAQSWDDPAQWYQTNVVANVALTERLRRFTWLQRYVHASTPEVYGSFSGVITEDSPMNPSSPYAASKAACDLHLSTFFRHYAFPVVFTRSANVYGPGQQLYRIIPRTILSIKTGQKLRLQGGGRSIRSFIHIGDVSRATLIVAEKGFSGQAYHLATDLCLTIREVVERICVQMGVRFDDTVEIVEDRASTDAAYLLDCSKMHTAFGWRATIGLDQGIRECIHWVNRDFDSIKSHPLDYIHKP